MTGKSSLVLQHVPFEGPALLKNELEVRGYSVSFTRFFENDRLPDLNDTDMLVILGGPMGVHDEGEYEWLKTEKKFIERSIAAGKKILGICLGAQIIADVLGAAVYKNSRSEIGWFEVSLTDVPEKTCIFKGLPNNFFSFHWHGDTFDIPHGAVRAAESKACKNQAFVYGSNVLALQFHTESTADSIESLLTYSGGDIVDAPYIQKPDHIRMLTEKYADENRSILSRLLDNFLV